MREGPGGPNTERPAQRISRSWLPLPKDGMACSAIRAATHMQATQTPSVQQLAYSVATLYIDRIGYLASRFILIEVWLNDHNRL